MSDTRNDAEQEMVNAGIASGLEDSLGVSSFDIKERRINANIQSSLSGSFTPPSMKPPPAPPAPTPAQQITGSTDTEEDAGPVPGMEEWKDTYDKYLSDWQAESSIARKRSEATRKQIEDEHAAIAKKMEDEKKSKKKEEAEKKRQKEREEKLKRELAEENSGKRRGDLPGSERAKKVKEAWEFVKSGDEGPKPKDVVADVRGVMPQDVKAGNVHVKGQSEVGPVVVSLVATRRI
jgi:hypothetical protein